MNALVHIITNNLHTKYKYFVTYDSCSDIFSERRDHAYGRFHVLPTPILSSKSHAPSGRLSITRMFSGVCVRILDCRCYGPQTAIMVHPHRRRLAFNVCALVRMWAVGALRATCVFAASRQSSSTKQLRVVLYAAAAARAVSAERLLLLLRTSPPPSDTQNTFCPRYPPRFPGYSCALMAC